MTGGLVGVKTKSAASLHIRVGPRLPGFGKQTTYVAQRGLMAETLATATVDETTIAAIHTFQFLGNLCCHQKQSCHTAKE